MNPDVLKCTMAARSVKVAALPDDRPMIVALVAVEGVASKEAVKEPVCVGKLWDCQEEATELTEQPGVVLVRLKLAGVATPDTVAVTV